MSTPPPFRKPGDNKKKPVVEIAIGVGKPKEGSAAEEAGESPAEEDKEKAAGKGDASDKKKPKRKSNAKPGPDDMKGAIAKRLAALSGPSPTNDNAGNASGGYPGM
jgi:hypothetical protein